MPGTVVNQGGHRLDAIQAQKADDAIDRGGRAPDRGFPPDWGGWRQRRRVAGEAQLLNPIFFSSVQAFAASSCLG